MPRGRPKLIGPLLPIGGNKTLNTKKRLADKAAAYDNYAVMINNAGTSNASQMSAKRGRAKLIGPLLPKGGSRTLNTKKRIAAKAAAYANYTVAVNNPDILNAPQVARVVKAKKQATAAQLAALDKARIARAQKLLATKAERDAKKQMKVAERERAKLQKETDKQIKAVEK